MRGIDKRVVVKCLRVATLSCLVACDRSAPPAEGREAAAPPEQPSAATFINASGSGVSTVPAEPDAGTPCAQGARCVRTDAEGHRTESGDFVAQCTGRFPDFVARLPVGYSGPFFQLSQDFPTTQPARGDLPWQGQSFRTPADGDRYLGLVRSYIYSTMPKWNPGGKDAKWFHVPWMTVGRHPREFTHGLTEERPLTKATMIDGKPELGLKPNATVRNFAIGYYNNIGAYTLRRVFYAATPEEGASASQFPEGTVVAKILFSNMMPENFVSPDDYPFDEATPKWTIRVDMGATGIKPMDVRLLQMDVAIRDSRAGATGWIFGTFAYDKRVAGSDGWAKMVPVGLMWGDDPDAGGDQTRIVESVISEGSPGYAKNHLGWARRLNGPVDNPASSCLSCHSTSEFPVGSDLFAPSSCTDKQKAAAWFRDLRGSQPFGHVDTGQCVLQTPPDGTRALDYSLQVTTALRNITMTVDGGVDAPLEFENPCEVVPVAALAAPPPPAGDKRVTGRLGSKKLAAAIASQGAYDLSR
jgi:hypothetical protein